MLQSTDPEELSNKENSRRRRVHESHCEGEVGLSLPVEGLRVWKGVVGTRTGGIRWENGGGEYWER